MLTWATKFADKATSCPQTRECTKLNWYPAWKTSTPANNICRMKYQHQYISCAKQNHLSPVAPSLVPLVKAALSTEHIPFQKSPQTWWHLESHEAAALWDKVKWCIQTRLGSEGCIFHGSLVPKPALCSLNVELLFLLVHTYWWIHWRDGRISAEHRAFFSWHMDPPANTTDLISAPLLLFTGKEACGTFPQACECSLDTDRHHIAMGGTEPRWNWRFHWGLMSW